MDRPLQTQVGGASFLQTRVVSGAAQLRTGRVSGGGSMAAEGIAKVQISGSISVINASLYADAEAAWPAGGANGSELATLLQSNLNQVFASLSVENITDTTPDQEEGYSVRQVRLHGDSNNTCARIAGQYEVNLSTTPQYYNLSASVGLGEEFTIEDCGHGKVIVTDNYEHRTEREKQPFLIKAPDLAEWCREYNTPHSNNENRCAAVHDGYFIWGSQNSSKVYVLSPKEPTGTATAGTTRFSLT